ncbi:MAG: adenylyltransferase/cytidyltransferase family protein [Pseudomonadales bacterium]|nr:adenylyltransferase/cytidyltransferase family protein [Pseudomonadales bacterium]
MTTSNKIYTPETLLETVDKLRENSNTIVFGNGCFDLLHVGHVRYLEAARALGDVLIIAVNTDESIALNVGRESPINTYEERAEVIAALACVDFVIPLADETPIPLLELLRPDIQAKGTDYTLAQMPEADTISRIGARVEFVGDEKTHSSSALRRELRHRS